MIALQGREVAYGAGSPLAPLSLARDPHRLTVGDALMVGKVAFQPRLHEPSIGVRESVRIGP
jgi:hypothetical protein